jgi:redox-sensitive bicupin YhaK (pirin superfamily)
VRAGLASGRGTKGSLEPRSDAEVLGASLFAGTVTNYDFRPGDLGYLVVSSSAVKVNGVRATAGEGTILREEATIRVEALQDSGVVFVVTSPE